MRFPLPPPPSFYFSGLITELIFPPDNLHYLGCKQMGSLLSAIGLCKRTVAVLVPMGLSSFFFFLPLNDISKPFPGRGESAFVIDRISI